MATADKLAKLAETKSNIKQAIIDKGVSVSDTDTFASYAEKIEEIPGGIPDYIAPKNSVDGVYKADNTATSFSLNGATSIGEYGLAYAFEDCTNLILADLSSLTEITSSLAMDSCFVGCTGLTSADLPSLTTISGANGMYSCFADCTGLTSVDLSSLTTVSGTNAMRDCFIGCTGLTSVNFSSLTTISGSFAMASCFADCTGLTSISFSSLKSFGTSTSRVNQLDDMIEGVTGCTLHFPSNMQSEVERRASYPDFGGTNTVVLFDLPPTA